MKKIIIAIAFLAVLTACKKNETEVKSEDTVIEGMNDTLRVDTDTINAETPEPKETPKPEQQPETPVSKGEKVSAVDYASFGDKIVADNALTKEQMLKRYNALKPGDTVNVKFKTKIKDVCKKKGCWMALELPQGKESFVKFKDYAFFVPLNADGQDAIVGGQAFVSEISVAQLKHYAKDGGKSEEEIAKITEPEVKYGFMANGVLISK